MNVTNIFKYAAKHKLRFPYKGSVSVEDLYDLNVEELDAIYKKLSREAKAADEESLLNESKENTALEVKIAIVKDIVAEKLENKARAEKAIETKNRRKRILDAMAKKDDEALEKASKEELQDMLNQLDSDNEV